MTFSGYGGTPEKACKFLEENVQLVFPKAFVTISDDSMQVVVLSPRTVTRMALVNYGDGKSSQVTFKKDKYGIMCTTTYP